MKGIVVIKLGGAVSSDAAGSVLAVAEEHRVCVHGAELDRPAAEIVSRALDNKLLVSVAGPQVLRLTPPLTVSGPLVEQALSILSEVLAP